MNAPLSQLVGRAATLSLAIGGPVAGFAAGAFSELSAARAVSSIVIYELVVVLLSLATGVIAELRLRWTSRITDSIDSQLQRYFSRYHRAFRQHAINSNSFMDTKGLGTRGERPLHYDEVFVSLSLDGANPNHLSPDPVAAPDKPMAKRDIWNWLRSTRNQGTVLAVIGPPGSGKTTLVRHVALTLARGGWSGQRHVGPRKLPIVVSLRDCSALFHSDETATDWNPPELAQMLRTSAPRVPKVEPPMWMERQLSRGRLCVMLDGLDEMPAASTRARLAHWVEEQAAKYPNTTFIVTSRPFGWRDNQIDPSIVLQVNPLSQVEAAHFIKRWYHATTVTHRQEVAEASKLAAEEGAADLLNRLQSNARILSLTVNPLLLTLVVNVHYYRGALPGSRIDLYNEVCDVFAGRRATAKGVKNLLTPSQHRLVLQTLAFDMMCSGKRDFTFDEVDESIKGVLSTVATDVSTAAYLQNTQDSTGLLIEREAELFSFAHHSFQEYLASCHIREAGIEDSLYAHLGESWWRETLRLYAAQVDATNLVNACIRMSEANEDMSCMLLGAQVASEARAVQESARRVLASKLDPPDARTNAPARAMAGNVRAVLRTAELIPLGSGAYASGSAVTNIEYRAFMDAIGAESLAPPHWIDGFYLDGCGGEPVTGMRPAAAAAFCEWMTSILGQEVVYRLPGSSEAGLILQRVPELEVNALWTAGLSQIVDEDGLPTDDVFPALASRKGESGAFLECRWGNAPLRREVLQQIETDASDLGYLGSQDAVAAESLQSWLLNVAAARVKNVDANATGLDLDWFSTRMSTWTPDWVSVASASRFRWLGEACQIVNQEARRFSYVVTSELQGDQRATCRRARLKLLLCAYGFDSLLGSDAGWSAWQRAFMPIYSVSRSHDSVSNARNQALLGYFQMCLLEMRLSLKSDGWEGLVPMTGAKVTELVVRIGLAKSFFPSLLLAASGREVSYRFDYSLATDPYRVIRSEVHVPELSRFYQMLRVLTYVRPLTGRRFELVPEQKDVVRPASGGPR